MDQDCDIVSVFQKFMAKNLFSEGGRDFMERQAPTEAAKPEPR